MSALNDINYLKGLVEGKNLADKGDEAKILATLVDIVQEQSQEIEQLKDRIEGLEHFKEDLDRSFMEAEQFMEDMVNGPGGLGELLSGDDDDDFYDEEDLYEVECDNCNNKFHATFMDFINDQVICPECGKHYELSEDVLSKLVDDDE